MNLGFELKQYPQFFRRLRVLSLTLELYQKMTISGYRTSPGTRNLCSCKNQIPKQHWEAARMGKRCYFDLIGRLNQLWRNVFRVADQYPDTLLRRQQRSLWR